MDLLKSVVALLLVGGAAQAQTSAWLPFKDPATRPSGQAAAVAAPSAQAATMPAIVVPQAQVVQLVVAQPVVQPQVQTIMLRPVGPGPLASMWGGMGEALQRRGARMARWKEPRYRADVQAVSAPQAFVMTVPIAAQPVAAPTPQASTAAPPPPYVPGK